MHTHTHTHTMYIHWHHTKPQIKRKLYNSGSGIYLVSCININIHGILKINFVESGETEKYIFKKAG